MFWDNEKDSAWRQRLKNGVFLKLWATNETRDRVLPWMVLFALGLVVLAALARWLGAVR